MKSINEYINEVKNNDKSYEEILMSLTSAVLRNDTKLSKSVAKDAWNLLKDNGVKLR